MGDRRAVPAFWVRLPWLALVVFVLLAATGLFLAVQYRPAPAQAHDSVASSPNWIRGVHSWAASALVLLVLLRLAHAWVTRTATAQHWPAWLVETGSLFLLLGAHLSGTILAWDQQGWESYQHLARGLRLVGIPLDADEPAGAPLGAVFLGHVAAVPVLLVLTTLVARRARRRSEGPPGPAFPGGRDRVAWALPWLFGILLLAIARPPEHGPAPIPGLNVTKPDWPFLWLDPLQDLAGIAGLVIGLAVAAAGAAALPRLGRSWPARARWWFLGAIVAAFVGLGAVGAYA